MNSADPRALRVLIIEDSPDDALFLVQELKGAGFSPLWARVAGRDALLTALKASTWDVVVCDNSMPGFGGLEALSLVRGEKPGLPFHFFSGSRKPEHKAEALMKGATGFFSKEDLGALIGAIRTARLTAVDEPKPAEGLKGAPELPRVLMVDDRMENLAVLEALLDGSGARLVKALSGDEALARLMDGEYALVLMDVRMPGLGGFETAELIRRRERTRKVPIIFLTAVGDARDDVSRAYALGAVDYLTKPFPPAMLRSKVAVFLELYRNGRNLARHADSLGSLNRRLEALASKVSREIRQPLLGVRKDFELLRRTAEDKAALPVVDRMEGSIEQLEVLIGNFIDEVRLLQGEAQ